MESQETALIETEKKYISGYSFHLCITFDKK